MASRVDKSHRNGRRSKYTPEQLALAEKTIAEEMQSDPKQPDAQLADKVETVVQTSFTTGYVKRLRRELGIHRPSGRRYHWVKYRRVCSEAEFSAEDRVKVEDTIRYWEKMWPHTNEQMDARIRAAADLTLDTKLLKRLRQKLAQEDQESSSSSESDDDAADDVAFGDTPDEAEPETDEAAQQRLQESIVDEWLTRDPQLTNDWLAGKIRQHDHASVAVSTDTVERLRQSGGWSLGAEQRALVDSTINHWLQPRVEPASTAPQLAARIQQAAGISLRPSCVRRIRRALGWRCLAMMVGQSGAPVRYWGLPHNELEQGRSI